MKKKRILLLIIILIILFVGAIFIFPWEDYKQKRKIAEIEKFYEEFATLVVKEIPGEGRIIESVNGDFEIKIPEGWRLKNELKSSREGALVMSNSFLGHIRILSPELFEAVDTGKERKLYRSKAGCLIEVGMSEEQIDIEEIEKEIREYHQKYFKLESEETFEIIEINGRKALKNMFDSAAFGYCIGVLIPANSKNYGFAVYSGPEDKEKCSQEFDNFLKTLKIN